MTLKDGKNSSTHGFFFLNLIPVQIFITFVIIAAAAATSASMQYNLHSRKRQKRSQNIIPCFPKSGSPHVDSIERFSHFVARHLGYEDPQECPQLCKLVNDYLRKSEGCERAIHDYILSDPETDASLFSKLIEEFDRCILVYFSFHWNQTSVMISQVLTSDSDSSHSTRKLKKIVMSHTRKRRFERVSENLKITRLFSTLVEEMKTLGNIPSNNDSRCTDVMKPTAPSERRPVLLLMGGGMGAGKSTVLKNILKDSFWAGAAGNAVVVEADAFKETDVIFRALSANGPDDMLQTSELVHQSSTNAACSLLVTALNEGRDVIMDGTLSWEPFFQQTIEMARNVHRHRYRMGAGYKVAEDGTEIEEYWEKVEDDDEENVEQKEATMKRKPYRIELVGVVCDPHLAVVRGIRRAIIMGRAVRVKSQLKSHKGFANGFPSYCQLVDTAKLYCTNSMENPPKLIRWKDGENNLVVDQQEIDILKRISTLNEEAESIDELYPHHFRNWKDILLSTSRAPYQDELKIAIQKAENQREITS